MSLRRSLAPAGLFAGALAGYFATSPLLGRYHRNPPELWGAAAVSAVLGARNLRDPDPIVRLGGVAGLAAPAITWWYLHRYSPYGDRDDDLAVGQTFPDFSLPTSTGGQLTAGDLRGDRVLLMCYRGGW